MEDRRNDVRTHLECHPTVTTATAAVFITLAVVMLFGLIFVF